MSVCSDPKDIVITRNREDILKEIEGNEENPKVKKKKIKKSTSLPQKQENQVLENPCFNILEKEMKNLDQLFMSPGFLLPQGQGQDLNPLHSYPSPTDIEEIISRIQEYKTQMDLYQTNISKLYQQFAKQIISKTHSRFKNYMEKPAAYIAKRNNLIKSMLPVQLYRQDFDKIKNIIEYYDEWLM